MQEMNEIEPDLLPGEGKGAGVLRISSDQVTGMIEWGQKSKPKKTPWDSNKTAKKSLHQNLTPQKSHAEFPNHKNFLDRKH